MSLESLFNPRGVVVAGSMTPGRLGAELIKQILAGGYSGGLYATNPKGEGCGTVQGFVSAMQIGEPVDLAVIASPAPTVASVLTDCGRAGVQAAVVITSGFSEAGNQAGEEELRRVAQEHGMRIVGPNCAGMVNTACNLYPTLELRPPSGSVALVSQSGALGGAVLARAQEERLGISKFVSYGNGADLTQVDFLDYLRDDPLTRVVALYIESVNDGRAFLHALTACAERKPVVVIKAGRTRAGARATASHTGSLSGADAVYDAAIRQAGAIRARSVDEMMDLCTAFSSLPPMKGKRLLIVTNSGGPGVLAADLAEELGLDVSEPCAASKAGLGDFIPGHASLKNPVDLTVEGTREGFCRTLQGLLPEYDAALAMNVSTPYLDTLSLAEGVVAGATEGGKPVTANFLPTQLVGDAVNRLKHGGVPNFPSGERAVAALAALAGDYARRQDAKRGMRAALASPQQPVESKPLPGTGPLLEPQAMAWLVENGLPVPAFQVAGTREQAAQAAQTLGFPVVMKIVSPEILHKSDVGGVVIGIRDENEARLAFDRICQAAEGRDYRGVVIYPMISGGVEVLVGLSRDAQFGPIIAVGIGGIFIEVLRDISLRIAPVDAGSALEMVNELRGVALLRGARGRPPCDLQALARLIARVSELPFTYPELKELDLNPVFALAQGVVIGDVRIIRT